MKKILGIVLLGLLLQGCATTEEIAAEYDNMSEERLCIFRYKFPDYNHWMPHVVSAIKRRNIDCSPYAAEGARQGRVLNALEAGTSAAAKTLGNQQVSLRISRNASLLRLSGGLTTSMLLGTP